MTLLLEHPVLPAAAAPSRRPDHLLVPALVLSDTLVGSVALLLGVWGRLRIGLFEAPAEVSNYAMTVGPAILAGWLVMIALYGGYRPSVLGSGTEEFKRIVNATILSAGLVGAACYLAKFQLSRGFFFLAFVVGLPLLLVERSVVRTVLHQSRARGLLMQRVLLVGAPDRVDEVAEVLRRERWLGYEVLGAVVPSAEATSAPISDVPVLGHLGRPGSLTKLVRERSVDVVLLAGGGISSSAHMRQLVWELERDTVRVVVAPHVAEICAERVNVRPVGGLPLLHIEPPTYVRASRLGKRTFDLVGSALLLLALGPILLAAALAIKVADGGAIFFRQVRVGRDSQPFDCLKLRTMVPDAESRVEQLQASAGCGALLFKLRDDPRVTVPGRWLRRFSVDELPQLINVLRGDMSLVGPRPQVAREVALYDEAMARRLHVRPGMTGLWQVSGRNDLTPEEAIRLDLYYVDNWSMVQDLDILRKTFSAVVSSRGAY